MQNSKKLMQNNELLKQKQLFTDEVCPFRGPKFKNQGLESLTNDKRIEKG